ncbi:DUF4393 domain-containing protein [bacterium]|nr:DUF4393 domain-containing protein [bacterium]
MAKKPPQRKSKNLVAKQRRLMRPRLAAGELASGVGALAGLAQQLPGANRVFDQLGRAEDLVLRELKSRLSRLDKDAAAVTIDSHDAGFDVSPSGLPERLAQLLQRAEAQSPAAAEAELMHQTLALLTGDEARLLQALSDGRNRPLVHLGVAPPIGPVSRIVAENFSDLAKAAMVKLADQMPLYLARLRTLGVIEEGPEDKSLDLKYQIIENDRVVRQATTAVNNETGQRVKCVRRSVRLSAFGSRLWAACSDTGGD